MNFSTLRNRKNLMNNYETPVKKLGFEKLSRYDEDISENELEEISKANDMDVTNENDESGIFEEMDLSLENIKLRIIYILVSIEVNDINIIESIDMIVPFLIFIFYSANLFFVNKLRLTYIYSVILIGTLIISCISKLISKVPITIYITLSILIYCLLPIAVLSFFATIFSLDFLLGIVLCICSVIYSSWKATKILNLYLRLVDNDFILFYPCILFYTCLTIILI